MPESEKITVYNQNCRGCMICQLACSFTYTDMFNPSLARIKIEWSQEDTVITFTEECTDCGVCADYCFYGCLVKNSNRGENK